MRKGPQRIKRGFTLVEVVVTVGIVAALAAIVYPTVVKQFDSADPARAAEDLNNIRTGIEVFGVNVRPHQPHDLEDLANVITTAAPDSTARGALYAASDVANWNGPYIALSVPPATAGGALVITSGFGATFSNRLPLYDVDLNATGGDTIPRTAALNADFLAVEVTGLSGSAFNAINELIDGPAENTAALRRRNGRFRCPDALVATDADPCPGAYYLASPIR